MSYHYTTDCTAANERDITRMRVFAREISGNTFITKCSSVQVFANLMGCKTIKELLATPGIRFYKSKFSGRSCYYCHLDGVKYIWCEPETN